MLGVAVESSKELLGYDGVEVDGAPAEVVDFFGVVEGEGGVLALGLVAGVAAGDGIALPKHGGHLVVIDRTGKAAVAGAEEAAVPARPAIVFGKPEFEPDKGVGGGVEDAGDAAEAGKFGERSAVGWGQGAAGLLGYRDRRIGQGDGFEGGAVGGEDRCGRESGSREECNRKAWHDVRVTLPPCHFKGYGKATGAKRRGIRRRR